MPYIAPVHGEMLIITYGDINKNKWIYGCL